MRPADLEALQRLRRRYSGQAVCALVSRQLSMDVDMWAVVACVRDEGADMAVF
jgi:hypothetical protein